MATVQETELHKYFIAASFSDADAATKLSEDGEIVSLMARCTPPDLFVVAFATRQGRLGPFALDRPVATLLRELLQQHGF